MRGETTLHPSAVLKKHGKPPEPRDQRNPLEGGISIVVLFSGIGSGWRGIFKPTD
jgi:hypothetical protein